MYLYNYLFINLCIYTTIYLSISIERAFASYDKDRSGDIDAKEFANVLSGLLYIYASIYLNFYISVYLFITD
jgi:hypothetical protein